MNGQGKFLISKRAPTKTAPNMWETTGGSAVSEEDSLKAALRETKEALGITLNPDNGKVFLRYTYPHSSGDGAAYIVVWLFKQEIDIAAVKLQQDETCDVMWADKEKIKQFIKSRQFTNYAYIDDLFNAASDLQKDNLCCYGDRK